MGVYDGTVEETSQHMHIGMHGSDAAANHVIASPIL